MKSQVVSRIIAAGAVFSALLIPAPGGRAIPPAILDTFTHDHCVWGDPLLGDDGFLYLTTGPCDDFRGSGLTKVDPRDGDIVWGPMSEHPFCSSESTTHSMSANGLLFAVGDWNACSDGYLTARRPDTGEIVWYRGTSGAGYSPHPRQRGPAIDDALGLVYFGSSTLFAVRQNDGGLGWSRSGGKYIGGEGMGIDAVSGVVYGSFDTAGGPVRAFRGDGSTRWSRTFYNATWDRGRVVAITEDNAVLVHHTLPNRLRALDAPTGDELWNAVGLNAVVTDEAGNLYGTEASAPALVSLTANGTLRWRTELAAPGAVSLDFVDGQGRVYARQGQTAFALRTSDGAPAWSWTAAAPLNVGSNLLPGGRLLVIDDRGTYTVFDTQLSYARSSWPMAHFGNRRHTGKVFDAAELPGGDIGGGGGDDGGGDGGGGGDDGGGGGDTCTPDDPDVCADADGDGICDAWDDCPGTTAGVPTGADGCEAGPPLCYSAADLEAAVALARAEGFAAGDAAGYTRGYGEGYADGDEAGYAWGVSEGYALGYSYGQADGYAAGYSDGSTTGEASGYERGFGEGYLEGMEDGFAAGRDAGLEEGFADGQAEGFATGFEAGRQACIADPASCGIAVAPGHGGTPPGLGGTPPGKRR